MKKKRTKTRRSFRSRFCNVDKFEELGMDTDSRYLALAHENLYDFVLPAEKR